MLFERPMVLAVAPRYAQEAAHLFGLRAGLLDAPHVRLNQLRRLDDRLAAHLDGLAVAGEYGSRLARAALESAGPGELFTATVCALEERDPAALDRLLALAQALPDSRPGLLSAFGWVSTASLRGITRALLDSPQPFRRRVGLAACSMHGVDAGAAVAGALADGDAALRARALRAIAQAGRRDLLGEVLAELEGKRPAALAGDDADADIESARCAFEAARAAVLLGERRAGPAALGRIASAPGHWRAGALGLWLKLLAPGEVHALLQGWAQAPADARLLIRSIGVAGMPRYVPWLIEQMQQPALARLAGEAFSLMTGLDLARQDLERSPPEAPQDSPADDPASADLARDEDHGLPWPDPGKIAAWWQAGSARFAQAERCFMGAPPSPAHCLAVLRAGCQRQRIAAAEWRSLLDPGSAPFDTAAPAWRQQRRLAALPA